MRSKILISTLGAIAAAALAIGQTPGRKIDFPVDSPVTAVSSDWSETHATPRGGAYLLDVHAVLSLRNSSQRRIRGVTLAVQAQEVTPGGKGTVSVPSLDVAPGEAFPLRIDLTLLGPLGAGGPMVEVKLDGVLFDDLTFYGSDKLHSRRTMTVWELEARRDRKYFKSLLETAGGEGLQKEILRSLDRQRDRPSAGVQMVRGRSTNADPERELQFAFLHMPDSPVDPTSGAARIAGNEARAPHINIQNRSERGVKYLEMGWIVKDQQGREFLAASMPSDVNLAPGKSSQVLQDTALRFSDKTVIDSMTGFVSSVEYADGSYWIPSRASLNDPKLRGIVAPSPEEQRLSQIYRKKGLNGLVEELKKF
jgi:hypothetical protein